MVIKVDRIYDTKQIQLLSDITIFNVHLEKQISNVDSNAISLEQALLIRQTFPAIRLSVFFNKYSGYAVEERIQILKDLKADYYECAAPDFIKDADYKLFLNHLNEIDLPKIVSGFFISKDDTYLLKESQRLNALLNLGVDFVEVDVDSVANKSFKLYASALKEFESICSQVPVLFSDSFPENGKVIINNSKGIYLNLISRTKDIYGQGGYDPTFYGDINSTKTFQVREIKKITSNFLD